MILRTSGRLLIVGTCLFFSLAFAATPAEQLEQYLGELQAAAKGKYELADNPQEDDLRRKIMQLVQGMERGPAVPEKYDELMGAAAYRFKNAANPFDFMDAATAFHEASLLAPWVPEVYFNMGLALEKAKVYDQAIRQFGLYLAAAPDAADARSVRQRIGGLRVAAKEAPDVGKRTYIERLRPEFFGTFINFNCNVPGALGQGCSVAETRGNWVNLENEFTITIEGDVIVVRHAAGSVFYRGQIECLSETSCHVEWRDSGGRRLWGEIQEDSCAGKQYAIVYVSGDRPVDFLDSNESRYHYWRFDKLQKWC
jgi:tetratricopeptide (TPR) repeat protein